jgi:hypothetical protein
MLVPFEMNINVLKEIETEKIGYLYFFLFCGCFLTYRSTVGIK